MAQRLKLRPLEAGRRLNGICIWATMRRAGATPLFHGRSPPPGPSAPLPREQRSSQSPSKHDRRRFGVFCHHYA